MRLKRLGIKKIEKKILDNQVIKRTAYFYRENHTSKI